MADDINTLPAGGGSIERPTRMSECTILLVVTALIVFCSVALASLAVHLTQPPLANDKIVTALFLLAVIAMAGLIAVVLANLSSSIGTFKLKAGPTGVDAQIDGRH